MARADGICEMNGRAEEQREIKFNYCRRSKAGSPLSGAGDGPFRFSGGDVGGWMDSGTVAGKKNNNWCAISETINAAQTATLQNSTLRWGQTNRFSMFHCVSLSDTGCQPESVQCLPDKNTN